MKQNGFRKKLSIFIATLGLLAGCQSVSIKPIRSDRTSIYRFLSAISDAKPDKESLTNLCVRKYGFFLELPNAPVKSAHGIRIPAHYANTTYQIQEVVKYKTILVQPPSINGIAFETKEQSVPYTVKEKVRKSNIVKGLCVGTEYILKQEN